MPVEIVPLEKFAPPGGGIVPLEVPEPGGLEIVPLASVVSTLVVEVTPAT